MMTRFVLLTTALVSTVGCLKTRNEAGEQRQVVQHQTTTQQRAAAIEASKMSDIEEQMRFLSGRVDAVENKVNTGSSGLENSLKTTQQQNADISQRMNVMQEALVKMESQVFQLNAEMQALKAEKAAAPVPSAGKRDHYEAGQEYFTQKDWKKAILSYQKYRDENSKGKNYPEATYKIGVCFQELGMRDEAKTFYDEVISKFPKSEQARKAKTRVKSLKK